jgi:hypothetical protein
VRAADDYAKLTAPIRPEGTMLNRVIASTIWMVLGAAAAFAQQPAPQPASRLPTCTQSMIIGTSQAVFTQFAVNLLQGNLGFACPINIGGNGALTPGNCTVSASETIVSPPSGTLTIDRACHVIGTISFTIKNAMGVNLPTQLSVSVWRSADGSRLSGNATVNLTCGSSPCLNNYISPFELVAGQ